MRRSGWFFLIAAILIAGALFYFLFGLYTVPPIGAFPQGATVIVRRAPGEPFFRSPDGDCLRAQGYVSLLCRAVALARAPTDRIVVRLPFLRWAYLASTGGRVFER